MTALLLLSLLLTAPPGDAVQTLDLARLSWTRALALDGKPVRVAFTVDVLPEEQGGTVIVEAHGPEDEARIVYLAGANLLRVNPGDRLVAEGTLRVIRHRSRDEFVGFVELRVRGRLVR